MTVIDLNCDMGESFGAWTLGQDAILLRHVTSANIACGFHAGDPLVMQATVQAAVAAGVAIGAHPGLADLRGFGRRRMQMTPDEAYADALYQIGALDAFVRAAGGRLTHVKPHGALYNMAAADAALADALARAVYAADRSLVLVGLSGSALIRAGERHGLRTASEVFADRTYQADGSLTARTQSNALHHDAGAVVRQVLQMVQEQVVEAVDGSRVPVRAETICIHGDGPHAVAFAQAIGTALASHGIDLRPLHAPR